MCKLGGISRAAYYKWLNHKETANDKLNQELADKLEQLHDKHPDMGYRRLNDKLRHDDAIIVNDKRILRICRKRQIKSNLKYHYDGCTRPSKNPAFIAENVLNREFTAEHPNEKWVTDVTEFKYGTTFDNVHKLYLSAILDLCDRRPVAYVIGDSNNNALVFETFDMAVAANPNAHPIFHSDRGYQYTSRTFHQKLEAAGMTQSMSRVMNKVHQIAEEMPYEGTEDRKKVEYLFIEADEDHVAEQHGDSSKENTSFTSWKELRRHLSESKEVVAALFKGKVWAFGKRDEIQKNF